MNGKHWSQSDTETLQCMAGKYTDEEIARVTGHATITVRTRRNHLGLPPCRRKDWTKRRWKDAA